MEIKVLLNGLIQKTALSLQQFNDQVDRIDFVLDRYTDNEVDLSACKAYVYTNAVGQAPDIIKLTDPTTEGGQIRTTWIPTVHTTQFVSKHIGEVAFQLIFKNTGGTPAWWSRPTPLIVPESIDAEGYVSAEMPSFFQQWEDRMNALDAEYEKTLGECKAYSEEAGKSADISFDGAATSTNNAYKTSADAESTASNAQKVEQDLQKVESHRAGGGGDDTGVWTTGGEAWRICNTEFRWKCGTECGECFEVGRVFSGTLCHLQLSSGSYPHDQCKD